MIFKSGIQHPLEFSSTSGETQIIKDIPEIEQSIRLILTSAKGELFGDPNFGCNLYSFLFKYTGDPLYQLIKTDIATCVNAQEPRVTINENEIVIIPHFDEKTLEINIPYHLQYTEYAATYTYMLDINQEDEYEY